MEMHHQKQLDINPLRAALGFSVLNVLKWYKADPRHDWSCDCFFFIVVFLVTVK